MSARPYQSSSVTDLKALVEAKPLDRPLLETVLQELALRRTQKAVDLRRFVEALVVAGAATTAAPTGARATPRKATRAGVPQREPSRRPEGAVTPPRRARGTSSTKAAVDPAPADVAVTAATDSPRPSGLGLEERHALLRETFTLEAEVLARWGMTPLLPQVLRERVVALWRAHLQEHGAAGHPYGLTLTHLENDLGRSDRREIEPDGGPS